MRPVFANAARSGNGKPSLIVSAVTPFAEAVFAPDAPDAPEFPELPELPDLLDELHAAATRTSTARTAALRIVRARMDTPRCGNESLANVMQERGYLNARCFISVGPQLRRSQRIVVRMAILRGTLSSRERRFQTTRSCPMSEPMSDFDEIDFFRARPLYQDPYPY